MSAAAEKPKRFEIFRAGRQTASDGQVIDFAAADLAATAAAYDPTLHEAPLCVGHPKTNGPAYGWVRGLQVDGELLYADADQVDPAFAELVRAGRYKKRSASFYAPDSPANPKPGSYYLRHVAFLGAEPPAVKGLRDPQFTDSETGVLLFSEWADGMAAGLFRGLRDWVIGKFGLEEADKALPGRTVQALADEATREMAAEQVPQPQASGLSYAEGGEVSTPNPQELAAQAAQLAADRAALDARQAELDARDRATVHAARVAEFAEFTGGLVKAGQLLPVHQAGLVAVLAGLPDAQVVEFAEGGATVNKPAVTVLREFLKTLPRQVDFTERAGAAKTGAPDTDDADTGASSQAQGVSLAKAAVEYQEAETRLGRTVSLEAAVQHVSNLRKA